MNDQETATAIRQKVDELDKLCGEAANRGISVTFQTIDTSTKGSVKQYTLSVEILKQL